MKLSIISFVCCLFALSFAGANGRASKRLTSQEVFLNRINQIEGRGMACTYCKKWVETVKNHIDEGYVYTTIIKVMKETCDFIEIFNPVIAETCDALVDDIDDIWHYIVDEHFTPEEVCCLWYHACRGDSCPAEDTTTEQPTTVKATTEEPGLV